MTQRRVLAAALLVGGALAAAYGFYRGEPEGWTEAERALIDSLQLSALPPLPADPSNAVADSADAARLGHLLFFDRRLSANGEIACASCHQPERRFTDGLPQAQALGRSLRNTMSLVGASYSPWYYWDGRKDSQWAQALAPLEDPNEHGSNRMNLARLVAADARYRELYASAFGTLPDIPGTAHVPAGADWRAQWAALAPAEQRAIDTIFTNLGKALAAYERLLVPGPARFDAYVDALRADEEGTAARSVFSDDEAAGLRLFIGKGRCIECHNGPLFTNNEFHNTGLLPIPGFVPDEGRSGALGLLRADPFNCLGAFSDADAAQCTELTFMRTGPELVGALRTPSLRNLGGTAPYMHKGQLATLREVLEHYNDAPLALIGHNEAEPLDLSTRELRQLEAFLLTLDAPPATAPELLAAPAPEETQSSRAK